MIATAESPTLVIWYAERLPPGPLAGVGQFPGQTIFTTDPNGAFTAQDHELGLMLPHGGCFTGRQFIAV